MSMGKRVRHDGDEQDAYSRYWRPRLVSRQRAGIVKKPKNELTREKDKKQRKVQ